MKRVSRVLSLVMVVALLAALPASTQVTTTADAEASDDSTLAMLVLINRLELSAEQMSSLHGLVTGLMDERAGAEALREDLEEAMIAFNGTGEELDELLAVFREDQIAVAESLRDSVVETMDSMRDMLSINQGLVLRNALPGLLGERGDLDGRPEMAREIGERSMIGRGRGVFDPAARGMEQEADESDMSAIRGQVSERTGEAFARLSQRAQMIGGRENQGRMDARRGQLMQTDGRGAEAATEKLGLFDILESLAEALELKIAAVD